MRDTAKKKIAYLLEYPLDLPGGAQMSTESLCMGLLDTEFEPVVICPHLLSKKAGDYPFRVVTYPMGEKRIPNLLMRRKAFRRILLEEKPDIVHIQMPESLITYGIMNCAGLKNAGGGKLQMIFTDRGLFYGYRKHSMLLMKMALKRAALMLTTTDFNRSMWLEGSKVRPIVKVANTISEKFLEFEPAKRTHEGFVLGLAGRICEEKDWPFAVELLRLVHEAGVDFKVDLVLSVFENGDDEKVQRILLDLRSFLGEDGVVFHQDYNQTQMSEYYYGVDVFVMTSRFESFGKAAVEAMSRGCALISTQVGGLPEVVGRKENLYTKEDPGPAVEYIKKAASDPEFLRSEQEFFRERYLANFSQERCKEDHLTYYRQICEKEQR